MPWLLNSWVTMAAMPTDSRMSTEKMMVPICAVMPEPAPSLDVGPDRGHGADDEGDRGQEPDGGERQVGAGSENPAGRQQLRHG